MINRNENKHAKHIFVNCWKCKKDFEITGAERCYEHLIGMDGKPSWTTKCSQCGACICHKRDKMVKIDCEVLNKEGIMVVIPSVKEQLEKSSVDLGVGKP